MQSLRCLQPYHSSSVLFYLQQSYTTWQIKDLSDSEKLQVVHDNERVYYLSNTVLYILFGLAQLVLSIGMADASKHAFPVTSIVTQNLGVIWSTLVIAAGMIGNIGAKASLDLLEKDEETGEENGEAAAVALWSVIRTIHSSLGGGIEIIGGIWVVLATWCYCQCVIQKYKALLITDMITAGLGVIAGIAGILTTFPALPEAAGAVFGVAMILWYLMIGIC